MKVDDSTKFPYGGEHRGKCMANIPAQFLINLFYSGGDMLEGSKQITISDDFLEYISDNLDVLEYEIK